MRVLSVDRRTLTGTAVVVVQHRLLWWKWTRTWASAHKGVWRCVETGQESRVDGLYLFYGWGPANACEAALVVHQTDAMEMLDRDLKRRSNQG